MATSLELRRRTYASKLSDLQTDSDLWSVGQELVPLLTSKPIQLVTGNDVFQVLAPLHSGVTIMQDPVRYKWVWNEDTHVWEYHCIIGWIVTVPAPPGAEPVLVTVNERATYTL